MKNGKTLAPEKKWLLVLTSLLFCFIPVTTSNAAEGKMKVVASISPLADFARQVGKEKVDVILLLPPGASPHTFEPSPKTVREISGARIFIRIGAGLEFWADRLVTSTMKSARVVTASDNVALIRAEGHDHAGADPHIWLDPSIAIKIVGQIADAFSAADPANSGLYRKNASIYIERLTALDKEIEKRTAGFTTREYVTFHPAWSYFSRRYGLKVAGVIEESPGKEPSARHIQKIIRTIKGLKTRVVFAEPQFSPRVAEAIAREAGARVLVLDPEGGQKGRDTYIELMRYNVSVMESAMR